MSNQPNILFILSDDHATQAISAYGSRINLTPNIDRIAAEGALFQESFCCNSLCAPSRAAILTGKHSQINGQFTLGEKFDGSQPTLPKILQGLGYQTCLFGKWHLGSQPTGFDSWKIFPWQGNYYNPDMITPEGTVRQEGHSTDVVADLTLDWLENDRDEDKPFMACCHFKAPHRPWMPAPRFLDLFEDEELPEPDTLYDTYENRCEILKGCTLKIAEDFFWNFDLKVPDPGLNAEYYGMAATDSDEFNEFGRMTPEQLEAWNAAYEPRNQILKEKKMDRGEMTSWAYQRYVKDYLRVVAGIDDNVGRLLNHLDETGLRENTIVIYCSDQGFYLGEHGWYDKRWMFEESMRMPFLMRWPGVLEPGSTYDQLIQNIDYAPTLIEAAGGEAPEEMQGKSLFRVFRDGETNHEELYYHYYEHMAYGVPKHDGIRTERYKLIHFYTEGEFNLFDLKEDPSEMRSLHEDTDYKVLLDEMIARYHTVRENFEIPALP